ncbi:MAG: DHH family phosphoesterase [Patescibacteria group bacterium]
MNSAFSDLHEVLLISSQPLDSDSIASGTILKKYLQSKKVNVKHIFPKELREKEKEAFIHLPFFDEFTGVDSREFLKETTYDAVILVDGSNEIQFYDYENTDLPAPDFSEHAKIIVVDHHPTDNPNLGNTIIKNKKASSATEVVLTDIVPTEFLDRDLAMLAYAGIVGDTGNFQWNFTPSTMRLAADLLEKGAEPIQITERYFRDKPVEYFDMLSFAIEHTEYLDEIQTQLFVLSYNSIQEHNLDKDRLSLVKYAFKSALSGFVKGYPRGIMVTEFEPGKLSVSGRGSNIYNKISLPELFKEMGGNGGGHFNSAGMGINMDIEEFRIKLFDTIKKLM